MLSIAQEQADALLAASREALASATAEAEHLRAEATRLNAEAAELRAAATADRDAAAAAADTVFLQSLVAALARGRGESPAGESAGT